jgi:hypothetical protein
VNKTILNNLLLTRSAYVNTYSPIRFIVTFCTTGRRRGDDVMTNQNEFMIIYFIMSRLEDKRAKNWRTDVFFNGGYSMVACHQLVLYTVLATVVVDLQVVDLQAVSLLWPGIL